ncbi:MAG TPA: hypothetical protein VGC41_25820 [Kofleriaceae bacterium]
MTPSKPNPSPKPSHERTPVPDPAGQSPENPIVFTGNNDVARGNTERANAEPEPAALHSAKVPGVADPAEKRREIERAAEETSK